MAKERQRRWPWILGGILALGILGNMMGRSPEVPSETQRGIDSIAARRGDSAKAVADRSRTLDRLRGQLQDACEREVKETLKAPATAKFPADKWQIRFDTKHDTATVIFGAVDAQNTFGALIRTDFACVGHVSPTARVYGLDSIVIGDQIVRFGRKGA